jgi:hypothetical protein
MGVKKAGNRANRLPSEGSALLRESSYAAERVSQVYQGGAAGCCGRGVGDGPPSVVAVLAGVPARAEREAAR